MSDPVVPQLSLEAKLKFQLMRCEIKETADLELLQRKALMLVDMFEMQQRASNAMLQQTFLKPRPLHPSLFEAS